MQKQAPYLIDFKGIGESSIGFISVAENQKQVPFDIRRVYWTYYTPESIIRGRHAHKITEQLLVAVAGKITVYTQSPDSEKEEVFVLDTPSKGLYLPPCIWHTMQYSHNSVQLVLASHEYTADDYIRNFVDFKNYWK